jgi:hypothetical protein
VERFLNPWTQIHRVLEVGSVGVYRRSAVEQAVDCRTAADGRPQLNGKATDGQNLGADPEVYWKQPAAASPWQATGVAGPLGPRKSRQMQNF